LSIYREKNENSITYNIICFDLGYQSNKIFNLKTGEEVNVIILYSQMSHKAKKVLKQRIGILEYGNFENRDQGDFENLKGRNFAIF